MKMMIALVFHALVLSASQGLKLGQEIEKVNEFATKEMIAEMTSGITSLARRIQNSNTICIDEINRIRNYVCAKCTGNPVLPSLTDIKQNINRPVPKILQLFYDLLDALTPDAIELVGERKYMMEEDFGRMAEYLKLATKPELGTPLEESIRISQEIDLKLRNVTNNFHQTADVAGRRKRQSTTTIIRSCSQCDGLNGVGIEQYIDIVCGSTLLLNIDSIMELADRYRLILNTTLNLNNYDPVIQEVEFDEKSVIYQLTPYFSVVADITSYKYRIEQSTYTKSLTPVSLHFNNLNETAKFLAGEIMEKHVYSPGTGFGFA
ncbi:uncharacterized protein LOC133190833 [Saccostrea echinata]|uniref:uncharacterized protein LOC133190833 n=1 Tax=Saccostrea echinata TaxID=191078 RepID=UPI002A815443|nr:uncharacterized protein LOC133190833 [Saccostrea echinata]